MTTIPNPYLHDAAAHVWADCIKDMSREDLLDLASGLLSILEGSFGQHWNEADDLVREYRPHLDTVTHGLGMSPDVHALLATAQQALQSLHKEAGGARAGGLLSGLVEGPRMVASMGGDTKRNRDPRQKEKDYIHEKWKTWPARLAGNKRYKSEFARKMLEQCKHLTDEKTITDWCREWEKNKSESC
ncbi:hypothetical protein CGK74_14445 [Thauera propionica]|uniref:Uncharacterized protein n=1 Tax=Thauera propionica TaxID=2019431 RepID=A0A235EWH1_9RHOO|nr:hypothetical protein [Thauera propionica]OYD53113.1 hypothetical protein CGK74_14445 [Thauera propionica]